MPTHAHRTRTHEKTNFLTHFRVIKNPPLPPPYHSILCAMNCGWTWGTKKKKRSVRDRWKRTFWSLWVFFNSYLSASRSVLMFFCCQQLREFFWLLVYVNVWATRLFFRMNEITCVSVPKKIWQVYYDGLPENIVHGSLDIAGLICVDVGGHGYWRWVFVGLSYHVIDTVWTGQDKLYSNLIIYYVSIHFWWI